MARIIIVLLVLVSGCAGANTRVTVARVHGEPSITIEFDHVGR